MYVRKFEADSLEEALKCIKHELGPDAIILKTVTNKGLKGAFKKKKIEITAAISERNYTNKLRVDNTLDANQKDKFYSTDASYVANMIDEHSKSHDGKKTDYGNLGLNKRVQSANNKETKAKPSLDDFLNTQSQSQDSISSKDILERKKQKRPEQRDQFLAAKVEDNSREELVTDNRQNLALENNGANQSRIDELEKKLYLLSKNVETVTKSEPNGLFQLRNSLRSLDINESYIQTIMKKMMFDLSIEELESVEISYEYALSEMLKDVNTDMPLFSRVDEEPIITLLLSETSSGQTGMVQKLGALKSNSIIITNSDGQDKFTEQKKINLAEKIFDLTIIHVKSIGEIVSECRKAVNSGNSVFIDYKNNEKEVNDTKRFIEGVRRSFDKVEVLVSLSAIHTELYNRKVLSQYQKITDGIVMSHLDICLNYGALFNITYAFKDIPYKFFGTGEVIPDDIEAATGERILAGVFQLD